MSTLTIDPIGLGLVRELAEADEALKSVNAMIKESPKKINWRETYEDCWACEEAYDNHAESLLSHLLIIPSPSIDTSAYQALWRQALTQTEGERENGKLWDAVEAIAQQAIQLYRGMK